MSDFIEKLNLAEKAAEDIYFAKINRELIEALHKRMEEGSEPCQPAARSSARARTEDDQVASEAAVKSR
mgnify:CR=1 FL=1